MQGVDALDISNVDDSVVDIADFVRRYGGSSSISLFDSGCEVFQVPEIEGIIGYHLSNKCAVVIGDPLCPPESALSLAVAFQEWCDEKGYSYIYVTASEQFSQQALNTVCSSMIEIGEDFYLSDECNPKKGSKGRALRNKLNNAKRANLEILEYTQDDADLEQKLTDVSEKWVENRKGPQIYLADVDLFKDKVGKRWFYAEHQNEIVGILQLTELEGKGGWLLQILMATPDAPLGTSEQLVYTAFERLKTEGSAFLSFGVAQTRELGLIVGLGKVAETMGRFLFKIAQKTFNLDKRRRYLRKFQPKKEPAYILFRSNKIRLNEIISLARSLHVNI